MLTHAEQMALSRFSAWLNERFGARLRELKLFGSRARGDSHEESDLDVAIVVDDLAASEAREVGYFSGDLLTEFCVVVSPFVVSTAHMDHLRTRERAIAFEIERDGVPL